MAIETKTSVDVQTLPPFKRFIMSIGTLPTSYLESMSYAELLMWFCNFLQEQVIPAVNNNADAIREIQDFLNTLDLQDEVDNKLDEMAEDGTLQEIIASYLNSKAIFAFDTINDLKNATNLINGSYAQTLGYYEKNDDGGALYSIRTITNNDVVNDEDIVSLSNEDLIAELICKETLSLKTFGAYGDNSHDDTDVIKDALAYCSTKGLNLYIPIGIYLINDNIEVPENSKVFGYNDNNLTGTNSTIKATTSNSNILIHNNSDVGYLNFDGNNIADVMLSCEARLNVHDIRLINCLIAMQPATTNSNISGFYRVKIRDSVTGINWIDNNAGNGQGCYFENIDMLGVKYGLILKQPSNRFNNLCIQGSPAGCLPIDIYSNSNLFMSTYLENSNASHEVDFHTSSYNEFYGNRVLMYPDYFTNNNGKNKIVMASNQNSNIIYNTGNNAFDKVSLPVTYSANGSPGACVTAEKDSSNNRIIIKTVGTGTQTRVNFDTTTSYNLENRCYQHGDYNKFKSPFFYRGTYTPSSLPDGGSATTETTRFNMNNPIYFAQTTTHGVTCEVTKRTGADGIKITFYNNSGTDLSHTELVYNIIGCDWIQ